MACFVKCLPQMGQVMRKPKLYANNKGADQPAHPHSLISAFVVPCLDSVIPKLLQVWVLPSGKPQKTGFLMTWLKWAATWQNQQKECAPREDSDQHGHLPSLIRVFAVRMKKPWVLSYPLSAQRRLWSDWVDAQADLSLRGVHTHFVGFVMLQLKWCWSDSDSVEVSIMRHTVIFLSFRTDRSGQTVGTQIRLLLETNKMACAPSKESDQPGYPPSLISPRCPYEESSGP